ncbi:MAG: EAL domain-containing protein [Actinobacteria bacterium]|nr:EAL domain-containing protein [Actinomycetota bacterium]
MNPMSISGRDWSLIAVGAVAWWLSSLLDWGLEGILGAPALLLLPAIAAVWVRLSGYKVVVVALVGTALSLATQFALVPVVELSVMSLAALLSGLALVGLLRIARIRSFTEPLHPVLLLLLSMAAALVLPVAMWLADPQSPAGLPQYWTFWSAAVLGYVVVIPVALVTDRMDQQHRVQEFLVVLCLLVVAGAGAAAWIGLSWELVWFAWLALLILIVVGWRYGILPLAVTNLVLVLMVAMASLGSGTGVSLPMLAQWQAIVALASVVVLTIQLLIEQYREAGVLAHTMFVRSPLPTMRVHRDDDGQLVIAEANQALGFVYGSKPAQLRGRSLLSLFGEDHRDRIEGLCDRQPVLGLGWSPQTEVDLLVADGSTRVVVATVAPLDPGLGGVAHRDFIVNVEDVTARREAERVVTRATFYDEATGLLNRKSFVDRLDAALHRMRARKRPVAVMVFEIDDYRSINESMGHAVGDRLVASLARRVEGVLQPGMTLARVGEHEFGLLLPDGPTRERAAVLAGQIQGAVSAPVALGSPVSPAVSIGVVRVEDGSLSSAEVLRRADLALYRAKKQGKANVEFYTDSIGSSADQILWIRRQLNRAVAEDGFLVAYQPIVTVQDRKLVGHEALVRLPGREGRILNPGEFLESAATMEILPLIDRAVMRKAIRANAADQLPGAQQAPGQLFVSVNAEADDIRKPRFAEQVLELLAEEGMAASRLTIEITETDLLSLDDTVVGNVAALREAGVRVAIDDFGTGYSSLSQLRHLNADILKIDRAFVSGMETDESAAAIVATIISLAHDLGLTTVAEGVETPEQLDILALRGCDRAQGYLLGRPEVHGSIPQQHSRARAETETSGL